MAVGAAGAVRLVGQLRPDVVTVDLHLSNGGGQQTIEQIMGHKPTPIVGLWSKSDEITATTVTAALAGGALQIATKPTGATTGQASDLRRQVRALRGALVVRHPRGRMLAPVTPSPGASRPRIRGLVAIAASTGGPAALANVIAGLAGIRAPVLVVQHIHTDFVEGLAAWMQRISSIPVHVAVSGTRLLPGAVYISPGGVHLKVDRSLRAVLSPLPATRHRPSADELFFSVAENVGASATGVLLTGMGDDGAKGLLAIRQAGGLTIAQDEQTSAVFGMPKAAQALGAVSQMLPVDEIAKLIVASTSGAGVGG
jgi:two-component system chemotaxis response regulator CheB